MSNNFFLADRVKELSRVEGRGSISLDGAVDGFSSFGDFYASGDVVFYAITDNVKYEVGSGVYTPDGSTGRSITRQPMRSSDINSGPYFIYGSGAGSHAGQEGYFYPLWLTKSAAISGVGITGASKGPYSNAHEHVFSGVPGVTFYMPSDHMAHGLTTSSAKTTAATSGSDYTSASRPVDFNVGTKEVFVTYPGARAVYNAYGIDSDTAEPKQSGLAFWQNNQILSYSSNLIWSDSESFLGIDKHNPEFAIDIGGLKSFSQVRASGFMDGGSGVLFSGIPGSRSGGRQLEPFLRNQVASTANGVIKVSGLVDQFIGFENQAPTLVFAGPASDCGCDDAVPTFRALTAADFPLAGDDGLDSRYVQQYNPGIVSSDPFTFQLGQVALYQASGKISYSSGIIYDPTNDRLGLGGGNVGIIDPAYTLDVSGTVAASSGYFSRITFPNDSIHIGRNTTPNDDNYKSSAVGSTVSNYVAIGFSAFQNSSGIPESVAIGDQAGHTAKIFQSSVAIGYSAATNFVSGVDAVFIGTRAGENSSKIDQTVAMGGGFTLYDARRWDNSVAIGGFAGYRSSKIENSLALGQSSMSFAAQSSGIVSLGLSSMSRASGIVRTVSAGFRATRGVEEGNDIVSIGTDNLEDVIGADNVISIGKETLVRSSGGLHEVTAIGYQAGYQAVRVKDSTFLGTSAGQAASGTFNIYVGHNAGIAVSGHENIEIIASGSNTSILTSSSVGKINIGNTIVGDVNAGSVGVGHMTNATPPATLFVQTSGANDHAMIIRQQGSGSKAPYFALQSGDATTFFQITNSGNVMTSGWMSPSGGLHLGDRDPTKGSGVGSYMLWNNGGTLIWDGKTIDTAGGTTFKVSPYTTSASSPKAVAISDGQLVTISGVSGVEVQQNTDRFLRISASGLSGVLQNQIDALSAGSYNFFMTASGNGANNNSLHNVSDNSSIALSGVSGIKIDFTNLTGGGNVSGIFTIGYDSNATFTANLIASGEVSSEVVDVSGRNKSRQLLLNGSGLAFSGVKGVDFGFSQDTDSQASVFTLDPSTLSGVLYDTTIASGNYIWEDHIDWRASGIAVSGQVVANTTAIKAVTSKSATSGIKIQNDKYILDSGNGGLLSFLQLTDINPDATSPGLQAGSGNILINDNSGIFNRPRVGDTVGTVAIGHDVGIMASGLRNSVVIGDNAGAHYTPYRDPSDNDPITQEVFIGYRAGGELNNKSSATDNPLVRGYNIALGPETFYEGKNLIKSIGIGRQSAKGMRYAHDAYGFGTSSLGNSRDLGNVTAIGSAAGNNTRESVQSAFFGLFAGGQSSGVSYDISIGDYASFQASGHYGITHASLYGNGSLADQSSYEISVASTPTSTHAYNISLGYSASYGAYNNQYSIFIGRDAGYASSGVTNSVFIGHNAGQGTSHQNSIILSNKALSMSADDTYPINYGNGQTDFILDISHGIQGIVKTGPVEWEEDKESNIHDVRLHIGPMISSGDFAAGAYLNSTTEIQPTHSDGPVLSLDQFGKRTERTSTYTSDGGATDGLTVGDTQTSMFVTTTNTLFPTTNDFIKGRDLQSPIGNDQYNMKLEIINKHGFPVIPFFTKVIGGNGEPYRLLTALAPIQEDLPNGRGTRHGIIPMYPGAFAYGYVYTSNDLAAGYYLAICVTEINGPTSESIKVDGADLSWKFVRLT